MPDLLALSVLNKIPWAGSEGVLDFHNAKSLNSYAELECTFV